MPNYSFPYTQIGIKAAVAVPGQAATPSQSVYTPVTYLAGEGGCKAGTFVWPDADREGFAVQANPNTSDPAAVRPLGLVERVLDVPNYDVTSQATDIVPENQALTIAVRGDYYVKLPSDAGDATAGQAVFVKNDDGTIKGAAAGTSVDGYAETSWRFVQNCTAGDTALISNWANQ